MASRRPETIVKRAREQALREKRERKQAKKDARAAERLVDEPTEAGPDADDAAAEADPATPAAE